MIRSFLLLLLFLPLTAEGDDHTRGIGVYPGRTDEAFVPTLTAGSSYRHNLSLFHSVYTSSSYDFNLTGHLLTDGILTSSLPAYLETFVNGEALPKEEREVVIDGSEWNKTTLSGEESTYCLRWHNMAVAADSIAIHGTVAYHPSLATEGYTLTLSSDDGTLYHISAPSLPGREWGVVQSDDPNKQSEDEALPLRNISFGTAIVPCSLSSLTVVMAMKGAEYWALSEIQFFKDGAPIDSALLPMSRFTSVWRSACGGEQWAYVDLGATSTLSAVALSWQQQCPAGRLEVSADATEWTTLATLPQEETAYEVPVTGQGRYVRLVVHGQDEPYMLSEMTVWGEGGESVLPATAAQQKDERMLSLAGGEWYVQRASAVEAPLTLVSTPAYTPTDWLVATVPATVLTSYINAGAVPEPNFDSANQSLSEAYFAGDFVYRRPFSVPSSWVGRPLFLNFDGINWKARVWLNGREIGHIDGAFMRGKFDITALVAEENVLVVVIDPPAHPGATKEKDYFHPRPNGGLLGADNPTFHAAVGWDWLPTVRGREIGIYNNVFLTAECGVSLSDPLITTTLSLPDTLATLTPTVRYVNTSGKALTATLHVWVDTLCVAENVLLDEGEGTLTLSPSRHKELQDVAIPLWWPNGYGTPTLHAAGCALLTETGDTLSVVPFAYGAREVSYADVDTALKIFVNGVRIIPKGGNWGFAEQNLRYRSREYDIAVRLHRDMNFNMIRNWVAQTADDAFYSACDREGILVWQDFCLANPADGPDPSDEDLFLRNATDYTLRMRHHPCLALYCGRNEGYPPARIDSTLRVLIDSVHPGMAYISSSADEGVSGHGPYNALPAKEYFARQTGLLHSERGMPCVMPIESLRRTFLPSHLWPQGDEWGQHDYTMTGAQRGASYNELIAQRWGMGSASSAAFSALGADAFATYAQLINYEGYRAMFEATSRERMGLLLWMSHPAWPSLSWQCYDYYFSPTGAYYGCKKACEPLHIQYNALTEEVEVVNSGREDYPSLRAAVAVYDLAGTLLSSTTQTLSSFHDSTTPLTGVAIPAERPFVSLSLSAGDSLLSTNSYVLAADLSSLPPAEIGYNVSPTTVSDDGTERKQTVTITNTGTTTAYLLRLHLVDDSGEEVLPVWYSDNYFHLLPGAQTTVQVLWRAEDQATAGTQIEITGLNIPALSFH